jgi:formylglycine-generating enzyme required for sulfatase activity
MKLQDFLNKIQKILNKKQAKITNISQKNNILEQDKPYFEENYTKLRLLHVSGGPFLMGANEISPDETASHCVTLSPFWIGETPVLNWHYYRFLETTRYADLSFFKKGNFRDPHQPVVNIDWDDAQCYCNWLSEGSTKYKFSLPSEAQWECAARGTDQRLYPWGNEPPTEKRACFGLDPTTGAPGVVKSYPEGCGPFETYDQSGTVWEWCLDDWNDLAYWSRLRGGQIDPVEKVKKASRRNSKQDDETSYRVIRGGCWRSPPPPSKELWAAYRNKRRLWYKGPDLGFRVVATLRS